MRGDGSDQTSIRIRVATADDADVISCLLEALGHPIRPEDISARLAAVHAEGGAAFLASSAAGAPVGLAGVACHSTLHTSGPVAYITALVVATSARRRGAGRALVAEAERWARSRGCARLSVTSAEHRTDAHAFYPSCGLPHSGRRYSKPIEPQR